MPFRVFVSYSWQNSAERRALEAELSKLAGVEIVVDRTAIQVGEQIHQRVSEMLESADCVIVLLTAQGLSSQEVRDEISRAHERKKFIIPVLTTDVSLEQVPWFLRDVLSIRYDGRDFDDVVTRLTAEIKRQSNPASQLRRGDVPARLWKLLQAGAQFIDIASETRAHSVADQDALFIELAMRETPARFVVRVSQKMRISDAAEYLAERLLTHITDGGYDWTLAYQKNDQAIPAHHNFLTAGVTEGAKVLLLGNHRMPIVRPAPVP